MHIKDKILSSFFGLSGKCITNYKNNVRGRRRLYEAMCLYYTMKESNSTKEVEHIQSLESILSVMENDNISNEAKKELLDNAKNAIKSLSHIIKNIE